MKVTAQIRQKIKSIPEGQPFGYADLGIAPANFIAAAKALERLQKKGELKKVSKGVFYKPGQTIFGELGPDYNELLKQQLFKNNRRVAYITGGSLYNQLNLTTQNYFRTKIATRQSRKKIEKGWLKTNTVKSYVAITEENYQLLGILDAIKDIKRIPDTPTATVIKLLGNRIAQLKKKEVRQLIRFSLEYPPRVRALLGAIIQNRLAAEYNVASLQKSLNPSTTIKIGISEKTLPNSKNWNIK